MTPGVKERVGVLLWVFCGAVLGYFVSYPFQPMMVHCLWGFGGYVKGIGGIMEMRETVWAAAIWIFLGAGAGMFVGALRK